MKLWLIKQAVNGRYDTYDSAVVAAEDENDARRIHPCGYEEDREWWNTKDSYGALSTWALPEQVTANLIGIAEVGTARGVVLSSFNAG